MAPAFKVIDGTLKHDGETYEAGDPVELSEEQAKGLNVEPDTPESNKQSNVKEMAALIDACETVEELDNLIEGDERKGVLAAAKAKKIALEEGKGGDKG